MSMRCGRCLAEEGAYCSVCTGCVCCCDCTDTQPPEKKPEPHPGDRELLGDDQC